MELISTNPFNNKVVATYREYSDSDIVDLLVKSSEIYKNWRQTSFAYRSERMNKLAGLLREGKSEYGKTITNEMGKPIRESIAEVEKCAWVCEYYAEKAEDFLKEKHIETDADKSYVLYEPIGPVLAIMPWNFPFWQVFRFTAPAIMAGNVAILKHASNVQGCAKIIQDLFEKAGFEKNVFINLVIGSSKVKQVIENNIVKAVTLTGSEAAGANVAEIAGKNIKKSVLELGGNNSFIVLADVDIEKSVKTGVFARMMNGGQSCIAAKRFILHKNIAKEFTDLFKSHITNLIVGDPLDYKTDIGPLSSVLQADIVQDQVDRSIKMGANILCGGNKKGAFYYPTLIADIKPGMPVFDEEVFGPVAPIIIAEDEEHAVELSNLSKFGLGVTICTNDMIKAQELATRIEDGAVFINELVKSDPRLPFGGTKRSGYGRELSVEGIREFVNIKTVYQKKM